MIYANSGPGKERGGRAAVAVSNLFEIAGKIRRVRKFSGPFRPAGTQRSVKSVSWLFTILRGEASCTGLKLYNFIELHMNLAGCENISRK